MTSSDPAPQPAPGHAGPGPPASGQRAARAAVAGAATAMAGDSAVGGREWLALPEFGIACIQALLDPAAKESTLLASDVVVVDEDGERRARFTIRPILGDDRTTVVAEAPLVPRTDTRGAVIRTLVTLDAETWPIDLRLVSHRVSRFPRRTRLHLGRNALGKRFCVRSQESFLAGPPATNPRWEESGRERKS